MSINYGDSYVHAGQALNRTVIKLEGVPVYVQHVWGNGIVDFYNFEKYCRGALLIEKAPLKDFDTTPFRMGYVNQDGYAIYCTRIPLRNYKQGLRGDNLKSSRELRLYSLELYKCLIGDYPTPSEALEKLNSGHKSVGLSRHFALKKTSRSILILYKEKRIGLYTKKTGKFKFLKDYYFLKENFYNQVKHEIS